MYYVSGVLMFIIMISLVHIYHFSKWNNSMKGVDSVWSSPFECGFLSFSSAYSSYSYGFISFLVLFVLFDLEMSLFLKFCFNSNLYSNFMVYYLFLLFLCLGFCFEVFSGSMKWLM